MVVRRTSVFRKLFHVASPALAGYLRRVLPYVRLIDPKVESEILLLTVPEVPEAVTYGVMGGAVDSLRDEAEEQARANLRNVAAALLD